MLISFFSPSYYQLGVDCSTHESLVFQDDLEFNPETQIAELVEEDGSFLIKISEKPVEPEIESYKQKKARIFQAFVEAETLDNFDWEGVEPTEQDYSNLIVLRNFSGDAGSQVAMLTKALFKTLVLFMQLGVKKEQIAELLGPELIEVQKISETREALGLNPFDLSFLTNWV